MKKRIVAILLSAAALATCALGFSACGSGCDGEYNEMTVYENKSPTCTKNGGSYYVYCPKCGKYWTTPGHKQQTTPEQNVISALGHSYSGGKCIRCGKTDPELLPDTLNIPDIEVSQAGVLTWGGIKVASKYRIEITDEDSAKHVYEVSDSESYELDLTNLPAGLGLTSGKNYASITAYQPWSEKVDGETIADDIPVTESKTEFIAIKQNSGYSSTALTYADEYITVNGAYADVRKDGGDDYILIEQQMAADKQYVNFNLSNKVKAAQGVTVTYYKDKNKTQSISKEDWRWMSVPAGSTDVYMTVNGSGGSRDYTVRVMAIRPISVSLMKLEKSGGVYNETSLMSSSITVLENDYIDVSMFYSKVTSSSQVVVDADFNVYERNGDCVMPLCIGTLYNFYVVERSDLDTIKQDFNK